MSWSQTMNHDSRPISIDHLKLDATETPVISSGVAFNCIKTISLSNDCPYIRLLYCLVRLIWSSPENI